MEIWEIGPEPTTNMAATVAQRVFGVGPRRQTPPNPTRRRRFDQFNLRLSWLTRFRPSTTSRTVALPLQSPKYASPPGRRSSAV